MINSFQPIFRAIASTTANNAQQVEGLLSRNGVVVPAALTTTQLNDAVILALAESDGFRKDFSNYLLELSAAQTGSSSMSGFKNYTEDFFNSNGPQPFNFQTAGGTPNNSRGDGVNWEAIGNVGSNLSSLIGNFFTGRQAVAVAKEQTESERIALERAQTERETAGLLARTKSAVTSNPLTTALIILGVGAVAYGVYYFYNKSK